MKDNYQHMYDLCKDHMHSYVLVETNEGTKMNGIITGLDDEFVYMAVPNNQPMGYDQWGTFSGNYAPYHRQMRYGYPGGGYYGGYYGGPNWGPGHGYGYSGSPFRRAVLPLAALTAISLLPWY